MKGRRMRCEEVRKEDTRGGCKNVLRGGRDREKLPKEVVRGSRARRS